MELTDLRNLISFQVREDQQIEYKGQMIRPEQICIAVSSFANAYGGDFYLGIEETGGTEIFVKDVKLESVL